MEVSTILVAPFRCLELTAGGFAQVKLPDNSVLIGIMNIVVERVCCSVCVVVLQRIRWKVALS
jgi:hypothetical protein